MANKQHLDILKQGVEVWNKWRKENPEIRPDLGGIDLGGTGLIEANLSGATLIRAYIDGADLSGADLYEAHLSGATLIGAKLMGTHLRDANLAYARIGRTIFTNTDLSSIKWPETINYRYPSTIGIDTLYRSKGQISKIFLRGCGLSDWEIESAKLYNPNLSNEEINDIYYRIHDLRVSRAFQINPLFISYSHSY